MAGGNGADPSGVKPFSIQGRLVRERERLLGMTEIERKWRKQWVEDQILHNEPVEVPQFYKAAYNPIRRAYRLPLDIFGRALIPILGERRACITRFWTGKILLFSWLSFATIYYFKYNTHDWTRFGGWRVIVSRPQVLPGDSGYPSDGGRKKPSDYYSCGFKDSPI